MNEEDLKLLYPGLSLSELLALGQSEIDKKFELLKAHVRARLDGSPVNELPNVQAQVKLVCEIHNAVLQALRDPKRIVMQ